MNFADATKYFFQTVKTPPFMNKNLIDGFKKENLTPGMIVARADMISKADKIEKKAERAAKAVKKVKAAKKAAKLSAKTAPVTA